MADAHFQSVLILADESANWKIGGLRQLDRLVLALDEFAGLNNFDVDVTVFWRADVPPQARWFPKPARIKRGHVTNDVASALPGACVLSTRLSVARQGLADFLSAPGVSLQQPIVDPSRAWTNLSAEFERTCAAAAKTADGWRYLNGAQDIAESEVELLRRTGKSQDGIVSRLINRPISRAVTRFLLKLPISPNACTICVASLSLLAFAFLIRGDYLGFVAGMAMFQLLNILDGCDGEIARAKYLESERGVRLDAFCDLVTNLLFIPCLGIGLFRQEGLSEPRRLTYLLESLVAVCLIAGRAATYAIGLMAKDTSRQPDRRDGRAIVGSSERFFGQKLTALLVQLTKRDVIFFGFFLLALANLAAWVVHIIFGFAVVTLFLRLAQMRRSD